MPKLVDTTIRLLSQEPLAGKLPTAEVLRVAEILDGSGFACLEVSGGGVFDATVRRRVESPWERIRAIKTRVSTPLGIALRGRFLVGSRPVSGDIVGRFVSCAAENGIDVFRLHDPAERRLEPARGGCRDHECRRRLPRGARLQPGPNGGHRPARRAGAQAPGARRDSGHPERPDRRARPAQGAGARRPHQGGERASCRVLRAGCLRRGTRVRARRRGVRRRPHRDGRVPACALAASRLRRVPGGVARRPRPRNRAGHRQALGCGGRHRRVDRGRAAGARRAAHRRPRGGVRPSGRARRSARGASAGPRGRGSAARGARGGWPRPGGGRLAAARRADRADPRLAGAAPRTRGTAVRLRHRRVPRARPGRLRRDARADSTRRSSAPSSSSLRRDS